MPDAPIPRWLEWARILQAIAQTGLHHTEGHYDRQNYARLRDLAAEITAAHAGLPAPDALAAFSLQPGYATVKCDVRAACIRDNRILLVQERLDMRWSLPGGWADVGEAPSSAAARETFEESGLHVLPTRVVGVYDANRRGLPLEFFHAFKIVFLCDILDGTPTPSHETAAVDFFPLDALPPLSSPRTEPRHLADIAAALADPSRPAAFD
ncbi:MAG: NUDIX hydrolase [Thermodesulfobacteriota bacterium]